jgi:DNA-binding response OmpR family regulator
VDLLFADVILPGGMTGLGLAERARALRPGLKVLFTTGYARSATAADSGRLDPGMELIAKPFTYAELAARTRAVLDGRGGSAGRRALTRLRAASGPVLGGAGLGHGAVLLRVWFGGLDVAPGRMRPAVAVFAAPRRVRLTAARCGRPRSR